MKKIKFHPFRGIKKWFIKSKRKINQKNNEKNINEINDKFYFSELDGKIYIMCSLTAVYESKPDEQINDLMEKINEFRTIANKYNSIKFKK